jgi:hypothetical protein
MAKTPTTATTVKGAEQTLGAPGFQAFGGMIVSNETNPDLKDRNKYKTYSELLANAAIVATGVRTFLTLISNSKWTVKPAEEDNAMAQEIADFIQDCMDDMATPWYRVVRRSAMYRFYGFSVQEWTAKKRVDGKIGMLDIEVRPPVTITAWDFDDTNKVEAMIQTSPQTQEEIRIPRWKTIYAVDDTLNDSPEGLGLFRHLVDRNRVLKRYEQLEGQGYETDLCGIPIAKGPLKYMDEAVKAGTMSARDREHALSNMQSFLSDYTRTPNKSLLMDSAVYRDGGETKPHTSTPLWELELLQGSDRDFESMANAIRRVMFEMAMILGVESLMIGANGIGSLALSRDKSQRLYMLVDSTLQELQEIMEHDFIWPLMQLNGFPAELMPTFETEAIQYREITDVTGALKDLATSGAPIMSGDPVVNEVRAMVGLDPVPDDLMDDMDLLGRDNNEGGIAADDVAEEDPNSDIPDEAEVD